MGFELQFEDVLLVNAVGFVGSADCVAEQREARQREVVLQAADSIRSSSDTCFELTSVLESLVNVRV